MSISAGEAFGRLTATGRQSRAGGRLVWECLCICGSPVLAREVKLRSGHTKSCGCLRSDLAKGYSLSRVTHGATTPQAPSAVSGAFESWSAMWKRCTDTGHQSYPDYGGRGISICPEWRDFSVFLRDMGPRPDGFSIERIKNSEGYRPDNCTWWPKEKQQLNRRSSIRIWFQQQEWCLRKLCEHLSLPYQQVHYRYRRAAWPLTRALNLKEGEAYDLARIE